LIDNDVGIFNPMTLTFDSVTPTSKGFLYYPGRMCGLSLRKVDQFVPELLIGNEKVTDRPTYIPTDMCKAIYPLFFEEGHTNTISFQMITVFNKRFPLIILMTFVFGLACHIC